MQVSLAYPSSPSGRWIHLLDVLLVVWTAGWILAGFSVGREVRGLTELSDTVEAGGNTLDQAGRQLDTLRSLPFVGNRIHDVGRQLTDAAASAKASGRSSREHIESLATLLSVAVAVAPTVPLVALYVPLRLRRVREVRAVRRSMARAGDASFDEFLARRATERLPYDRLRKITPSPWDDLEAGRYSALADAELRRLGIRRPRPKGVGPAPSRV
jgi:hypothetical protein